MKPSPKGPYGFIRVGLSCVLCCKLCCLLWSSLLLSTLIFFLYSFLALRGAVLCCFGISLGLDRGRSRVEVVRLLGLGLG